MDVRKYVVYVQHPPSVRIESGMFHIEFQSGGISFEYVMSPHNAHRTARDSGKALAMFDAANAGAVVPLPRKRRGKGHAASE